MLHVAFSPCAKATIYCAVTTLIPPIATLPYPDSAISVTELLMCVMMTLVHRRPLTFCVTVKMTSTGKGKVICGQI